jgi:hypothetical protein
VGAVVLLAPQANTYVLADTATHAFIGCAPTITMLDVDGDGTTEAIVRFDTGRGLTQTWVFQVANQKLRLLSPTDQTQHTLLADPEFVSLTGGRALDIVEESVSESRENPIVTQQRYVLQNGVYTAAAPLDFAQTFYREKGTPRVETATLDLPAAAVGKPFRVVVVNGGSSGTEYRVSSGEVRLNGVPISGPSDFGQHRATWTIPVSLQQHNTLTVRLEGKPRGRIIVAIRHD